MPSQNINTKLKEEKCVERKRRRKRNSVSLLLCSQITYIQMANCVQTLQLNFKHQDCLPRSNRVVLTKVKRQRKAHKQAELNKLQTHKTS